MGFGPGGGYLSEHIKPNFIQIRPVVLQLKHADGDTHGRIRILTAGQGYDHKVLVTNRYLRDFFGI